MDDKNKDLIRKLAEVIVLLSDEGNDYDADYIARRYLWDITNEYMEG